MFIVALAGSAFTRISNSSKDVIPAYYYNSAYGLCKTTSIDPGQCIADDVGNLCYVFVFEYGKYSLLYQNGTPFNCYTPFYSYY
jgi:hypothetical protein